MELDEIRLKVNELLETLSNKITNDTPDNDIIFLAGNVVGSIFRLRSMYCNDYSSYTKNVLSDRINKIIELFSCGINDTRIHMRDNVLKLLISKYNMYPEVNDIKFNGRYAWKSEIGDDKKEFYLIYLGGNKEVRVEWHIDEEVLYLYLENEYSMKLFIPFEETEGIIQGILKANKLSIDSKYLSKNY